MNNNNAFERNWSKYCTMKLNEKLNTIIHRCSLFINCTVQSYWNLIEDVILKVTDNIIPLKNSSGQVKNLKNFLPPSINAKINKRRRLLKINRINRSTALSDEIKSLSKDIKSHLYNSKTSKGLTHSM